jgi:CRISPR-associated protein Csm1
MTAAMAICLDETDTFDEPFLLVKADMSGIQNYISEIVSASAAKNLKGRSFYVQLLSDAVLRKLLNEFDLPQANIVYNSGGNFLLLVPNTEANKEKVDSVEKEITEHLFNAHKTTIAVIIDFVEVSRNDLQKGTHGITKKLTNKIDEKKKRKFSGFIASNSNFFEPKDVVDVDVVTGEDIEANDLNRMTIFQSDKLFRKDGDKEADFHCGIDKETRKFTTDLKLLTFQQICLGRRLKKADYLVIGNQAISDLRV